MSLCVIYCCRVKRAGSKSEAGRIRGREGRQRDLEEDRRGGKKERRGEQEADARKMREEREDRQVWGRREGRQGMSE